MNFFRIRVIVNDKEIYTLTDLRPVVIEAKDQILNLVITDGFHITKPVKLTFAFPSYYNLKISCAIDDFQLIGGFIFLAGFYLLGFFTGILILKLLSFLPIVLFLIIYYTNRRSFIRVVQERK